tara:strand:+ start:3108 stop:3620 length:513 start_codon:yes stop_codon:yes gene_type:complete
MEKLIKNRSIVEDPWLLLKEVSEMSEIADKAAVPLIVPLAFWQENRQALKQRPGKTAVWLQSDELPASLGEDLHSFGLIALNFPVFSDGRVYSSARELRSNFMFKGELRAIGDVLRDQLFYMARCGFDAFALREDQNIDTALAAFDDFRDGYQVSVDKPEPLFRRREHVL